MPHCTSSGSQQPVFRRTRSRRPLRHCRAGGRNAAFALPPARSGSRPRSGRPAAFGQALSVIAPGQLARNPGRSGPKPRVSFRTGSGDTRRWNGPWKRAFERSGSWSGPSPRVIPYLRAHLDRQFAGPRFAGIWLNEQRCRRRWPRQRLAAASCVADVIEVRGMPTACRLLGQGREPGRMGMAQCVDRMPAPGRGNVARPPRSARNPRRVRKLNGARL